MNMLEEIKKARDGKPSKVKLHPVPEEDFAVEYGFKALGLKVAFGQGLD